LQTDVSEVAVRCDNTVRSPIMTGFVYRVFFRKRVNGNDS